MNFNIFLPNKIDFTVMRPKLQQFETNCIESANTLISSRYLDYIPRITSKDFCLTRPRGRVKQKSSQVKEWKSVSEPSLLTGWLTDQLTEVCFRTSQHKREKKLESSNSNI